MRKIYVLLALSFTVSFQLHAQHAITAMEAYDTAQQARSDAEDLWSKKNATPAEIDKSIRILKNALVFLDSMPIKELEFGNIYLKARRNDVTLDLVRVYASTGQTELALTTLEKWYALGSMSSLADYLQKDSDFIPIRNEPRFLAIINKLKSQGTLFNNSAFKTAYSADLSPAETQRDLSVAMSSDPGLYTDTRLNLSGDSPAATSYLPSRQSSRTTRPHRVSRSIPCPRAAAYA